MSGIFSDPFPHAAYYTSFSSPVTLSPVARGLLLSNFAAGAASITFTTVNSEVITVALGTLVAASLPIFLPVQASMINSVTGVGTVTALWH